MVVCPIMSNSKSYPFEVALPEGLAVIGFVLADHIKSLDWRSRGAVIADQVSPDVLVHVRAKLKVLLFVE